jgi:DNA-binding CsgD family transcriptional regulator
MQLSDVHRRAGGRRRYNHQRRLAATERRREVVALLRRGLSQRAIATQLGVSEATISRDCTWLGTIADLVRAGIPCRVRIWPNGNQVTVAMPHPLAGILSDEAAKERTKRHEQAE